VICLFGCGGDRDSGKRPDMGSVASTLADLVVLTSDNPRTEDPLTIIEQVQSGIDAAVDLVVDPDRARAIRHAIELARPGDVVVLAGKGHETTQTIGDTVVPFDDRVEARSALSQVGGGAR
jgi:UDP-N-acetylmuramoyl-L-alanyl-D-glutamate--2,6-diaminopimelate ligase